MDENAHLDVEVTFNKPAARCKPSFVWLKGASVGMVQVETVELSKDKKSLTIKMGRLPEDRYSLRLLSGREHFRDNEGNPLDGSGNGSCENAPGLFKDSDHFAVDFRVKSPAKRPSLR